MSPNMTGDTLSNQLVFHRQRQASSPQQHLGVFLHERPTLFPPYGHLEGNRIYVSTLLALLKNSSGLFFNMNTGQSIWRLCLHGMNVTAEPRSAIILIVCSMRSFFENVNMSLVKCPWHVSTGENTSLSQSPHPLTSVSHTLCVSLSRIFCLSQTHTRAHTHTHTHHTHSEYIVFLTL